jgi:hypothetical protein
VNDFSYHNNPEEHYIRMNLMKNSHKIKSLSENLSANVDAIKIPLYSKYMKDIITNKRKILNDAITAMLASYSFEGKLPEKRGDPGIPTIPCTIKRTYVKYALCDLGAGISFMPFSLYKKLNLNKLVTTEVSLQMADKLAILIGICEDVPIYIANVLIPTDFVILEILEDENLSIILGRPFLNTAGAVINCTESKVTFNVRGNEHTIYSPKKNLVPSSGKWGDRNTRPHHRDRQIV